MKKTALILAMILLLCIVLVGCTTESKVSGKVFHKENPKDVIGFTISLCRDGTFAYSTSGFSSYIGMGEWKIENNLLVLYEYAGERIAENLVATFYFGVGNGKIAFVKSEIQQYDRMGLKGGEVFKYFQQVVEYR